MLKRTARNDDSHTFNPGLARDLIRIMKPHKSKNDFGEDIVTLIPYVTGYAQVAALQGHELDSIQQRWADARYRIRMQFTPRIEREYTILWSNERGEEELDIFDVQDLVGVRNFTQIYAGNTHAR